MKQQKDNALVSYSLWKIPFLVMHTHLFRLSIMIESIKNVREEIQEKNTLATRSSRVAPIVVKSQCAPFTNRVAHWLFSCSTSSGASIYSRNWLFSFVEHLDFGFGASFGKQVEQVTST